MTNQPFVPDEEPLDIFDYARDAGKGVLYGASSFGQSVYNLADWATGDDLLADTDFRTEAPETLLGDLVGGITQFSLGLLPGVGIARLTSLGTVARGALAGGIADFVAFDPNEARLSNLAEEYDGFGSFVTDYLAADPEDGELEGRFKNVLEGAALGGVVSGITKGIGKLTHLSLKRLRAGQAEARKINQQLAEQALKEDKTVDQVLRESGRNLDAEVEAAAREAVPDGEILDANKALLDGDSPGSYQAHRDTVRKELDEAWGDDWSPDDVLAAIEAYDLTVAEELKTLAGDGLNPEIPDVAARSKRIKKTEKGRMNRIIAGINLTKHDSPEEYLATIHAVADKFHDKALQQGPKFTQESFKKEAEAFAAQHGLTVDELSTNMNIIADDAAKHRTMVLLGRKGLMAQGRQAQAAMERGKKAWLAFQEGKLTREQTIADVMTANLEFERLGNVFIAWDRAKAAFSHNLSSLKQDIKTYREAPSDTLRDSVREIMENRAVSNHGSLEDMVNTMNRALDLIGDSENLERLGMYVKGLRGKKVGAVQMVNEYFINMILSSPRTMVTNTVMPLATGVFRSIQEGIGGALRGDKAAIEDTVAEVVDIVTGIKNHMDAGRKAFKTGRSTITPGSTKLDPTRHSQQHYLANLREQQGLPAPTAFAPELHPNSPEFILSSLNFIDQHISTATRAVIGTDELVSSTLGHARIRRLLKSQLRAQGYSGPELLGAVDELLPAHFSKQGTLLTPAEAKNRFAGEYQRNVSEGMPVEKASEIYDQRLGDFEAAGIGENALNAMDHMEISTFKKELAKDSIQAGYSNFVSQHPLLRLITPFIKTPANILNFAATEAYSPFQYLTNVYFNKVVKSGQVLTKGQNKVYTALENSRMQFLRDSVSTDPATRDLIRGRAAVATSSMTAFAAAAYSGLITGRGPEDPNQRKTLMAAGWRPYSLKVGNTYVSYERLDPLASVLGGVADMVHYGAYEDMSSQGNLTKIFGAYLTAHLNNVTQKSYLTGVRNIINAIYAPEQNAEQYIKQMVTAFTVPAAVSSIKDSMDPLLREARDMQEAIYAKTPVFSTTIEPYRDIFGEPIKSTQRLGADTIGGIMNIWMPIAVSEVSDSEVSKEMANLQASFSPISPAKSGVDLTEYRNAKGQTAFDRYQELSGSIKVRGKNVKAAMKELIRSGTYQKLDPRSFDGDSSSRIKLLKDILTEHRAAAWKAVRREFPDVDRAYQENRRLRREQRVGGEFPYLPFDL